jgi:hypothetical protein
MKKKRDRTRPALSLQERLAMFARTARDAARQLPQGSERSEMLRKARDLEAAAGIERWLMAPAVRT